MQSCPTGTCPLRVPDGRRDFPDLPPVAVPPPNLEPESDLPLLPVRANQVVHASAPAVKSKFNFGPHAFFFGIAAGAVFVVVALIALRRLRKRAFR